MRKLAGRIAIAAALLGAPAAGPAAQGPRQGMRAPGPSFDCGAASTAAERMICADDNLRALDLGLSIFYASARRGPRARQILRHHRDWLRSDRGICAEPVCLREALERRLWQLSRAAGDLPAYRNEDGEGAMVVAPLGRGWYAFGATGIWRGPTVNSAAASGAFRLDGDRGEVAGAPESGCYFSLIRMEGDRWRIIVRPPAPGIACGGMNATVEGEYRRAGQRRR